MAGAAFDSGFNLRSARFPELLGERARLRAPLAAAREALVDALHAAVPHAPGRDERRALIAAKRAVFNGRALEGGLAGATPELQALADEYTRLWHQDATVFERHGPGVLEEVSASIERLLRDPRFRLACFHSSPDLREQLERATAPERAGPSSLERGIHAYAAKLVSKASPFHVFASLLFPPGVLRPGAEHEVVADGGAILELERRALAALPERGGVRVCMRTFTEEEGTARFWAVSASGVRLVALRSTPLLRVLAALLREAGERTGSPTLTRAECESHLRSLLPPGQEDAAPLALDRLVEHGVLAEYLVTDFAAFAPALAGAGEEVERAAAALQRHHLARVSAGGLARVHQELDGAAGRGAPVFWVNSYSDADPAPHLAAAEAVSADLADLAPCFAAEHNFSEIGYVAGAFTRDLAGCAPVPYLELLRHFLRGRDEAVARYHPDVHRPAEERAARDAWRAAAAGHDGVLGRAELAELAARAPAEGPRPHLCFNGPYDYAAGELHVSNVFAGCGRFAGRYLLDRGAEAPACGVAEEPGVVDVELALPPHPNMNYVVRRFAAGCGFEARYSHRYERWIEPSEVVVAVEEGRTVYRHAATGQELRFHHAGFMLGQFLGAEYQLLLAGHADSFRNPFHGRTELGEGDEVRHRPGLRYGRVVVRRERWGFRAGALAGPAAEGDLLRFAALLRDWVHERVRPADGWYYRVVRSGAPPGKPLYLDLLNPLSVLAFRRELAARGTVGVSLTVAAPDADGLVRHGGRPYVSELMVEV